MNIIKELREIFEKSNIQIEKERKFKCTVCERQVPCKGYEPICVCCFLGDKKDTNPTRPKSDCHYAFCRRSTAYICKGTESGLTKKEKGIKKRNIENRNKLERKYRITG